MNSTLKDFCIGPGSYGIPEAAEEYIEDQFRYLRITDITDDGFLLHCDRKTVSSPNAKDYLLGENDIVFARTGNSTGRTLFYEKEYGDLVYAGYLIKFTLDPKKINPRFIKYYTISSEYKKWIENQQNGSTRGNLNAQSYADMPVNPPPRKQQDYMVSLLDTITAKIELDIKICSELESLAQDLYHYWFTQFDFPDENGRPYRSSGGKMVWNDKLRREIPKGWEAKKLIDIIPIQLGGTPDTKNKRYWDEGEINWLSSGEIANFPVLSAEAKITQEAIDKSATVLLKNGSVALSITRYIRPTILGIDACINQSVVGLEETTRFKHSFLYPMIKSQVARYMSLRIGAMQPHINKDIVEETVIACPSDRAIDAYYQKANPIFRQQMTVAKEAHELASLRDFLLPLLMSGQVKIGGSAACSKARKTTKA